MLESGQISNRQLFFMLFCIVSSASLYVTPLIILSEAKQDFWIVLMAVFALNMLYGGILYVLGLRYPGQTTIQYCQTILGAWVGKLIGTLFILFFLLGCLMYLQTPSYFITTALMPDTPRIVFHAVIIVLAAYAVNSGLEVVARLGEIIGPVVGLALMLVLVLNIPLVEVENLRPIFQHSFPELVSAVLMPAGIFGFSIFMGVSMPFQNNPKDVLRVMFLAVGISIILIAISIGMMITVVGLQASLQQAYPLYRLAQMIDVGDFFERLESLVMLFWIAGTFMGFVNLYYYVSLGTAQILKLHSYQSVTPVIGAVILILSLVLFRDVVSRTAFVRNIFPYLALAIEGGLTSLLLAISFIRHGRKPSLKRSRS